MKAQVSGTLAEPVQTVGARDKVTVYGWKALAGSVIGYSMDGFDLLIVWLHARCHLSGPGPDKHSGRLARYMDVNGRGCGRARFWDHERPFWPNQSADVDDSSIRRIHRSLRSGAGVLGPGCLSGDGRSWVAWRVRNRDGARRRGLAGQQARPGVLQCCTRVAGGSPSGRARYTGAAPSERLALDGSCSACCPRDPRAASAALSTSRRAS